MPRYMYFNFNYNNIEFEITLITSDFYSLLMYLRVWSKNLVLFYRDIISNKIDWKIKDHSEKGFCRCYPEATNYIEKIIKNIAFL